MTLRTRIVCDACSNDRLFGTPHLTVGTRPALPGSHRDMHFCSPTCLQRHLGNLQAIHDEHARLHGEFLRRKAVTA